MCDCNNTEVMHCEHNKNNNMKIIAYLHSIDQDQNVRLFYPGQLH